MLCYVMLCVDDVRAVSEDGVTYDVTSDFALQTLNGDVITDVRSLRTALKHGNVVIRAQ